LKWKYTGRDHEELCKLNIFQVLHRGNNDKDSLIKNAWGKSVPDLNQSIDQQSLSKSLLELFEQLFLAVAGRIVEPDFGDSMKLKAARGAGQAPQLQKAKSVIDENVSEQLLGQAFEVIFKEIEKYSETLLKFKGIDWRSYVDHRNTERKNDEDYMKDNDDGNNNDEEDNDDDEENYDEENDCDEDPEMSESVKDDDEDESKSEKSSKKKDEEPKKDEEKAEN